MLDMVIAKRMEMFVLMKMGISLESIKNMSDLEFYEFLAIGAAMNEVTQEKVNK
jgi:hypothetical protein